MKKILLLSAVLLGAVTASQAGIRFDLHIPIPVPPVVVAPPAYVQPAPTYVEPAPNYYAPPDYYAPDYYAAPPVVVGPPVINLRFGHEPYWQHQFRYRHDRDDYFRGYHRYYDRDFHGYHHDNDHHDYNHGYGHRR